MDEHSKELEPLHILILSGSQAKPSHTLANMRFMANELQVLGARATIWNVQEKPLPFHNPIFHRDPLQNESEPVRELAGLAVEADGFVFGTPVYHGSFSGALKNALDNLSYRYFRDKPVALVGNGGRHSAMQPLDQLRLVISGLYGIAIPTQAATTNDDFDTTAQGFVLVNVTLQQRFQRQAQELLQYARNLRQVRAERT